VTKAPPDSARRLIPDDADLDRLREIARTCDACPIHEQATQTVFGEGPPNASLMLIGEQPGDQEDRRGRPFVGPAGELLDWSLQKAGIARERTYVTNVVKHFKWVPRGRIRMHDKASSLEIKACRPWLDGEIRLVAPEVIVCLGSTAAQALFGASFRVTRERGRWLESTLADHVMATVHPSSLLRIEDRSARHEAIREFVRELRMICEVLA
jgi:uracil-DNA glycosylase family protein